MSIKAICWAFEQRSLKSRHKLVLLVLANNANDQNWSFSDKNEVASICNISVKGLERSLLALAEKNLIQSGGNSTRLHVYLQVDL